MSSSKKKSSKVVAFENNASNKDKGKINWMMIGTVAILVLVVVSFVLLPALPSNNGGYPDLGRFGNRHIRFIPGDPKGSIFYEEVKWVKSQNIFSYEAETVEEQRAQTRAIWSYAYDNVIDQYAMMYYVEESGYNITENRIDLEMVDIFTINGEFDRDAYRNLSSQKKLDYRNFLREMLTINTFKIDFYSGHFINENEIEFLKNLSPTERNFKYVLMSFDDFPADEVVNYGEENSQLFRNIHLSRIIVDEKSLANDLIKQYEAKTDTFENLARIHSTDAYYKQIGGDMGRVYRHNLISLLSSDELDIVMNLQEGEVSKPIEIDKDQENSRWVIYMANEAAADPDFTDAVVQNEVRNYMERFEIGLIETYLEDKSLEFSEAVSDSTFSEASADFGLEMKQTGFFPINFGNNNLIPGNLAYVSDDLAFAGASSSDIFLTKAFSLKEPGDLSEPIILDRAIVVLEFIGERDITTQPYDSEIENFALSSKQTYFETKIKESELFIDRFDEAFERL